VQVNEPPATAHPVSQPDAHALLGLVIVVQGELYAGQLEPRLLEQVRQRVETAGLVPVRSGPAELLLALDNLNQRLRWVIGEYDQPLSATIGRVDHHLEFDTVAVAEAFAPEVRWAGDPVRGPAPASDGGWRVTVTTTELALSAGFDAHADRLRVAAERHGGRSNGFGGAAG